MKENKILDKDVSGEYLFKVKLVFDVVECSNCDNNC